MFLYDVPIDEHIGPNVMTPYHIIVALTYVNCIIAYI